jgi:hypothetical protein
MTRTGTPFTLTLAALAAAVAVALAGSTSTSIGQSPVPAAGLAYAGKKGFDPLWVRVHATRRLIEALEISVPVSRERCSNRKGYFTSFYGGTDNLETIVIGSDGEFADTITDRYRDAGSRYEEIAKLTGKVDDERVSLTIRGTIRVVRPNGLVVRCTFGPQRWTAFN